LSAGTEAAVMVFSTVLPAECEGQHISFTIIYVSV